MRVSALWRYHARLQQRGGERLPPKGTGRYFTRSLLTTPGLISALGRDYTNGIWVSQARRSHVLAIPVPKDLDAQFKLPPQPVKTR